MILNDKAAIIENTTHNSVCRLFQSMDSDLYDTKWHLFLGNKQKKKTRIVTTNDLFDTRRRCDIWLNKWFIHDCFVILSFIANSYRRDITNDGNETTSNTVNVLNLPRNEQQYKFLKWFFVLLSANVCDNSKIHEHRSEFKSQCMTTDHPVMCLRFIWRFVTDANQSALVLKQQLLIGFKTF